MKRIECSLDSILDWKDTVRAGDSLLLSGTIYTARDAAHKRLLSSISQGETLPFALGGATIYYCGPTPNKSGQTIGSCGPTTSARMDRFTPDLLERGLVCTIGKGDRDEAVYSAIKAHRGLYLVAIGGCGALYADCVIHSEEVAYPDLGCESIKKLIVKDFPVYVGIDTVGGSIFKK
jgi:fumarate hydratase subunit beta